MKRVFAVVLIVLLLPLARAEVFEGVTAALETVPVVAEVSGVAAEVVARAGDRLAAGEALISLSGRRVFATQDGEVASIAADVGEDVEGTALEVLPLERYLIYCTVSKAYQSAASTLVHSGETLFIKCTKDGTHRATGVVTAIDGETYRVLTLAGELYLGETVYLYRGEDFASAGRVGIGTVLACDPEAYEADGTVTRLCVAVGDPVERGQLLFELDGGAVTMPVDGVVASVAVAPGDAVAKDQVVAEIVPSDQIGVELRVDEAEAARIRPGDPVTLTLADAPDTPRAGTVASVDWVPQSGEYRVRVRVEDGEGLALGMSVVVWS